ncbi:LuxR C-terminal-related transcriptional regulator [Actinoplanes sp. NPDC049548]|uniref:LuxR C-terminal-related transcriptional regulator n=1 Tax=Actinoplanes sp. NPDC049548 TaxID=3155152 RepID=UPI00341F67E4
MNENHRLSDADRQEAIARLRAHRVAGRLTSEELTTRTEAAGEARTRADLNGVFADLPDDDPIWRRGWRDTRWRAHALAALVLAPAALLLWQVTRDPHPPLRDYGADYWWPLWAALTWAALILLHFLSAAGLLRRPAEVGRLIPPPRQPEAGHRSDEPAPAPAESLEKLTTREREVLAMVGRGLSNKDIARALFISERTARTHVSNILRKLDLSSRTQAALLADRAGART